MDRSIRSVESPFRAFGCDGVVAWNHQKSIFDSTYTERKSLLFHIKLWILVPVNPLSEFCDPLNH